jgi:hypothetical protein
MKRITILAMAAAVAIMLFGVTPLSNPVAVRVSWNQKRLQFPKERVENEEITAATLKNFAKSLKVFCDCADKAIPWKKITKGLPKGRQAANDRAPTLEELNNEKDNSYDN